MLLINDAAENALRGPVALRKIITMLRNDRGYSFTK